MKNDKQADILKIIRDWKELIENAQEKYVFGKALNKALFKRCMKSAFEWFLLDKEPKHQFDRFETDLYGHIFAYSRIPVVMDSENTLLFEASLHSAGILASAILHPEVVSIDGYKLIDDGFLINGEFKAVAYDFKKGDLKDYIELVKIGYWD